MGVDYSAHLAYGVEAPEIDDEKFPDGWWEYEQYYWIKLAESLDVDPNMGYTDERREIMKLYPCPLNVMAFGDNYGGTNIKVLTPNKLCFHADTYDGGGKIVEVPTPDPVETMKIISGFCELLGVEAPTDEPKWYFGMYVS